MAEHPNATLIRKYLEAMTNNDLEAASDGLTDDVEWHEIGRAEPIRGKAALAERYGVGGGGSGPSYDITGEVHDVIGGDDHTIALLSAHATRGNEKLDYRVAEIYHIRDGKISARWAFSDDTAAINDFFKGE
jgi:ketosteroid isomerase-like protein